MKKIKRGCVVSVLIALAVIGAFFGAFVYLRIRGELNYYRSELFANDVSVYVSRHGAFPANIDVLCDEIAEETSRQRKDIADYRHRVESNLDIQQGLSWKEVVDGADYVKAKPDAGSYGDSMACVVNFRLRLYLGAWECEKERGEQGMMNYRNQRQKAAEGQSEGGKSEDGK